MKEIKNYQCIAFYDFESDKAIQLSFSWRNLEFTKVWFPKSQITFLDKDEEGNCEVLIPFWLLYKNETKAITLRNTNSNSIWCDIFREQDKNGMTNHGYAL